LGEFGGGWLSEMEKSQEQWVGSLERSCSDNIKKKVFGVLTNLKVRNQNGCLGITLGSPQGGGFWGYGGKSIHQREGVSTSKSGRLGVVGVPKTKKDRGRLCHDPDPQGNLWEKNKKRNIRKGRWENFDEALVSKRTGQGLTKNLKIIRKGRAVEEAGKLPGGV